jgi:hypothetical protein
MEGMNRFPPSPSVVFASLIGFDMCTLKLSIFSWCLCHQILLQQKSAVHSSTSRAEPLKFQWLLRSVNKKF